MWSASARRRFDLRDTSRSFPGFTERTLALVPHAKYSHCSACARDGLASFAAAALHSASAKDEASSRCVRSVGRKLTRPSKQPAGALKKNDGLSGKLAGGPANLVAALLARLEPSRCSRFSLIALGHCEDSQTWPRDYVRPESELWARCFACRPGQDLSNSREHGACCSCVAKHADLTEGGHPLGCLRLRRQAARGTADRAHAPSRRSSRAPLCRRRLRMIGLALARLRQNIVQQTRHRWPVRHAPSASRWVGMNDRRGLRCSCLRACGLALRTGNSDNTHCAFVPSCLSHYFILIAPTLLTREPLQRGIKLRTMWRCLHYRCFTVTLTASRIPHPARCRPHRGSLRASLQASFTPTHRSA